MLQKNMKKFFFAASWVKFSFDTRSDGNNFFPWPGGHWVVGKGKHQNYQDAPTKRIYERTKDYKEDTQAKSQ